MSNLPRVLIISPTIIGAPHSGGILLKKLFASWPSENIALIYSQSHVSRNENLCKNYYQLDHRINKITALPERLYWFAIGKTETIDGILTSCITNNLSNWIEDFKPDIVYSHLGPVWLMSLTRKICAKWNLPLAIHVMDDYILDWPQNGNASRKILFSSYLNSIAKHEFKRNVNIAQVRLSISDSMSTEYEKRYNVPFREIRNGANLAKWQSSPQSKQLESNAKETIVFYGGSIFESTNFETLYLVAKTISKLAKHGHKIKLKIACHPRHASLVENLAELPQIEHIGMLPYEQMPKQLQESDVLLLPFNFKESTKRFIAHSWPTKVAEYMASGVPILLCGPSGVGFIEDARKRKWGHVVDESEIDNLASSIIEISQNLNLRKLLSINSTHIAKSEFDINTVRKEFSEVLMRLTK